MGTKREPRTVSAFEILEWLRNHRPGPDEMGGGQHLMTELMVEKALREICK